MKLIIAEKKAIQHRNFIDFPWQTRYITPEVIARKLTEFSDTLINKESFSSITAFKDFELKKLQILNITLSMQLTSELDSISVEIFDHSKFYHSGNINTIVNEANIPHNLK